MAGLFSKRSKKDKEDKAAAKNAAGVTATSTSAAAPSASASGISSTGPPVSTGSIASSTSNLPPGTKPGMAAATPAQGTAGTHVAGNHGPSAAATTTASEYAMQQQLHAMHGAPLKPSFESDKARMYHFQQQQQQQQQQQHNPSSLVANSSVSTHNSFANSNGPWISTQVTSQSPFPRFSHTASYVQTGSEIYVFGGIAKGATQKDMHVVDFQSLHCQVLPSTGADWPPATAGHSAVTLGQYIMYFGGKDVKNKCSDVLYVLHTVRKEWNRPVILGLLPAPRHSHAACVIGTVMYIFGGQFNGYYLNDIASFDMKSLNTASPCWNRLEPMSELPPARAGHCAAAHNGKIYVFGGADDQFFYNDIWCYDPQINRWEAVPAFGVLPTSRQGHAASVVDDTMYIYGGMNHEDQFLGDLSAFKFNDRRWLTFPDTVESPSPRTEHAMCSVGDKIYILGGQLDLNADDDAGLVYILDTTKIRYHEPSSVGSQRSTYDNDSILRTEGGLEDSSLSQRPSPSLDSNRHHADLGQDTHRTFQSQPPQHVESSDYYSNSSMAHPVRFADDSAVGTQLQTRMSLDGPDSNSVSRRRTLGKPAGYGAHDVEPRATQSIDEMRHPAALDNGYYAQGQRSVQFGGAIHPSSQQQYQQQQQQQLQQQQDVTRRRSLDSRNRGSLSQAPPRASLDQSKATTATATATPTATSHASQTTTTTQQQQDLLAEPSLLASKDAEIKDLRQREQWLLAEVAMARKRMGERPLSLTIALKEDMGAFDVEGGSEKHRIVQALLAVKAELERSKTSIVTQAQVASNKLREAERVRTAALQEAAYLKAKVSALQSGEVSSLASTETARAVDLEKRLMAALAMVDRVQSQSSQNDILLERERHVRETAQERERLAAGRAEEAELSHTRALAELATLHERASRAEASLRECEAKNATNEAGLSSYQQQSTALFSQISTLKTTVDHQKKSLEKAKLAYSVANDRAEHADRLWTQARQESDSTQLEFAGVRADLERAQREADHWKAKAQDTDLLWQKAKNENEAMRTLLEEDMNASAYSPGTNSRKHDSIMAITSASRVAELEHELGTLRHLLRESQAAAAQANKDLGETMVRISQLEQTSMAARAEASSAQRQLTASEDKVALLEGQLSQKEESLEEMAKQQENNEVQLGVLRGVMRENGLLADDLILEALSQGADGVPTVVGTTTVTGLKNRVQELEERVRATEAQREDLDALKRHQEARIQQLEADYQTAVHYVQGSESMLQRLRDETLAAKSERDVTQTRHEELKVAHAQCIELQSSAGEAALASAAAAAATLQLEEEVAELHRQLHDSMGRSVELEQKVGQMSKALRDSEAATEAARTEFQTLKAKHHEHKKQGAIASETYQTRLEQLEATQASLAETRHLLERSQYELDQAHELNRSTGEELEGALKALKASQESVAAAASVAAANASSDSLNGHAGTEGVAAAAAAAAEEAEKRRAATYAAHQEELELVIDNAQKTILELQVKNQDLEQQLRTSENKVSILLDNFQGPDSVRNSMVSLTGSDDIILRLLETNQRQLPTTLGLSHLLPSSRGSHATDRSSSDSLARELEVLRSNWGQQHLNGSAAYRPDSANASTAEAASPEVKPESIDVTAAAAIAAPSASSSAALPTGREVSGSNTNQSLDEYEKMIEDMANARRHYEE